MPRLVIYKTSPLLTTAVRLRPMLDPDKSWDLLLNRLHYCPRTKSVSHIHENSLNRQIITYFSSILRSLDNDLTLIKFIFYFDDGGTTPPPSTTSTYPSITTFADDVYVSAYQMLLLWLRQCDCVQCWTKTRHAGNYFQYHENKPHSN